MAVREPELLTSGEILEDECETALAGPLASPGMQDEVPDAGFPASWPTLTCHPASPRRDLAQPDSGAHVTGTPASSGQRRRQIPRGQGLARVTLDLITLGRLELRSESGDVVRARRMLLALLVWLARRRDLSSSRDRLIGLFWDARDQTAARHSLRQSLTELRVLLPGGTLQVEPDRVSLAPRSIRLDLADFEARIASGDWRAALEAYGGEFLAGLDDVGGEEWRGWIDGERAGLRRQLATAFEGAIAAATRQASWTEAIQLAERWHALDADSDHGMAALARALIAGNQRELAASRLAAHLGRLARDGRLPSADLERLTHSLAAAAPAGPRSRGLLSPDLAGRGPQFERLVEAWASARTGPGRVIVVEADDGMGKSRLVEEFTRLVRGGQAPPGSMAEARAFAAEEARPWKVAEDLLDQLAGAPGLLAASPEDLATLAGVSPRMRQRFPGSGAGPAPSLAEALPRVLAEAAAERPVLLVVDDADHADRESTDLFAALARRLPAGILLLLTARPSATALQQVFETPRDRLGRIRLAPLDEAATTELVASMAPCDPDSAREIAQAAVQDLGGAPGHTRALVTALAEDGVFRPNPRGTWSLTVPLPRPVSLPEQVLARTGIQLGTLPPSSRELLALAAAAGERVPLDRLEMASDLAPAALQEQLGELVSRRLLRMTPGDPSSLEFPTEATRRAVLASLPPGRAEELRRRIARGGARDAWRRRARMVAGLVGIAVVGASAVWFSRRPVADAGSVMVMADVRNDTGDPALDRTLTLVATVELNESGRVRLLPRPLVRETLARMGLAGADSLLDEALAREVAERENIPLVLAMDASRVEGRYLLTARLLRPATGEVARALSVRVDDRDRLLAGMERLLNRVRRALGEVDVPVPSGDDGLPRVSTGSLEALRAYADGQAAWARRDYGSARAAFDRAVALDSGFALAWASLADEAYRVNNAPLGAERLRRALGLAGRLTPRERLALQAAGARRLGTTAEAIEAARRLAEQYPDRSAWYNLGTQLMQARNCEQALPAFQRSLEFDTAFANTHINMASCHQFVRRFDSAVVAYQRAERLDSTALRMGNVGEEYGAALVMTGRADLAEAHFATMTRWGPDWNRGRGHRQLAWRRMADGRFAEAAREAERAITLARASNAPLSVFRDRLILARAQLGLGDSATARTILRSAWRERPDSLLEPGFLEWTASLASEVGATELVPAIRERVVARVRPGVPIQAGIKAAVLGLEALAAGRAEEALRYTEEQWPPPPDARWTLLWAVRAEALDRTDRVDSALALWQAIAASPWLGNELQETWVRADLAVARLAMRAGRPAEALAAVNRFLGRWKDADPGAPDLAAARRLRDQLSREGRPAE